MIRTCLPISCPLQHEQETAARQRAELLAQQETEARQRAEVLAQQEAAARQHLCPLAQQETTARRQAEDEIAHLRADLARFQRPSAYYEAHYDELLARYPEQWIAIFDQAVVGTAAEVESLLTALRQRHVPPEQTLIKHLTIGTDVLILPA